jgi:tripartite-type tricarboxylate transporter receptor subunit TctC
MNRNPLIRQLSSAVAAVLMTFGSPYAAAFPDKPLKIVVPYAAGGPVDQLGRSIAEALGRSLGQPVVVENKPGANTIVAASQVAKAPADGHTLLMASSASLAVNPLVYRKLTYNPDEDFAAISMVAQAPLVMVVNQAVAASNLKELTSLIRKSNGRFAYASNGNGNPLHLACALFSIMANVETLHVPYNGTAPALASVLANDTQMTCDIVLNSLPQIKAGKLKPIAIIGPGRVAELPQVPTLAEEGLLGVDAAVWFALVAPKRTPAPVLSTLNGHLQKVLAAPEMKARFAPMAMEVQGSTAEEVSRRTMAERAKWAKVVDKYRISLD